MDDFSTQKVHSDQVTFYSILERTGLGNAELLNTTSKAFLELAPPVILFIFSLLHSLLTYHLFQCYDDLSLVFYSPFH